MATLEPTVPSPAAKGAAPDLLGGWSIEVTPRTAARVDDFAAVLPRGTRVYIAHIAGTGIDEMVRTARRLAAAGFPVMPHVPARAVPDAATLDLWLSRYREEADVRQALLVAGNAARPAGAFDSSIQLLETGLFDRHGFTHLFVAGHPEGNPDLDRSGGTTVADRALAAKQAFSRRTDARMAIVTQFMFDARAVTDWSERIRDMGITLPLHVGIAGPARLDTLIRFAISCGIGPSLSVLRQRARDVTRLLQPYEPAEVIAGLAAYKARHPQSLIEQLHVFPFGGIGSAAAWMNDHLPVQRHLVAG